MEELSELEKGSFMKADISGRIDYEADIEIYGQQLSFGQAMTLRVALSSFIAELQYDENSLGTDELGRSMRKNYLERAREIERKIIGGIQNEKKREREIFGETRSSSASGEEL